MPQFDDTPAGLIGLLSEVDLYQKVHWQSYDAPDDREPTDKLTEAACASSRLRQQPDGVHEDDELHYLMIDLDGEHYYVPSTTPGHGHLYVKQAMPWRSLSLLLEELVACGIVESGYVAASHTRKSTTLRLPWVAKNKRHELFEEVRRMAYEMTSGPDWEGQVSDAFAATLQQNLDLLEEQGPAVVPDKTPEQDPPPPALSADPPAYSAATDYITVQYRQVVPEVGYRHDQMVIPSTPQRRAALEFINNHPDLFLTIQTWPVGHAEPTHVSAGLMHALHGSHLVDTAPDPANSYPLVMSQLLDKFSIPAYLSWVNLLTNAKKDWS